MLRALYSATGVTLRCRNCGERWRLVHGIDEILIAGILFGLTYLPSFLLLGQFAYFERVLTNVLFTAVVATVPGFLVLFWFLAFMHKRRYVKDGAARLPDPRRPGWVLALTAIVAIAIAAGIVWVGLSGFLPRRDGPPRPTTATSELGRIDYQTDSWSGSTIDGKPIPIASLSGKTVFLNVWATNCAPCVLELPSIEKLRASLADTDVQFVQISYDKPEKLRAFLEERNLGMRFVSVQGRLPAPIDAKSLPTTFILAGDGSITYRHVGAADWNDPAIANFLRRGGRASNGK